MFLGFPGGSEGKESACNVGDLGSIPGLGGSPREGNNYSLQYSGLKNSMKSRTPLSNFDFQGMSSVHSFEKNKKLCSILMEQIQKDKDCASRVSSSYTFQALQFSSVQSLLSRVRLFVTP